MRVIDQLIEHFQSRGVLTAAQMERLGAQGFCLFGPKLRALLEQTVEMIELSSRASNCLKVARIKTIRALVAKKPEELMAVKNFGKKSLDEIQDRLKDMGLSLGMCV